MTLKNMIIMMVVLVIATLIGLTIGYSVHKMVSSKQNNTSSNKETNKTGDREIVLEKGTFNDGGSGMTQAYGYVTTEDVEEAFCSGECKTYKYVFFNILKTENASFTNYINGQLGNSYVRKNAIGLGCYLDNEISYYNHNDTNAMKEYKLSTTDTDYIMKSTEKNPIILELNRLELTGGGGAPECYSHMTTITTIK